jgi:hypothetical protein
LGDKLDVPVVPVADPHASTVFLRSSTQQRRADQPVRCERSVSWPG